MSLLLAGVRVLVAEGPDAGIVADLLQDRGAHPVRGATPPREPVGLVRIPVGTPADTAASLLAWARDAGIPVDDRRGPGASVDERDGGEVVLVGGGPGDPDLVTVAGAREIATADVILTDHLGPVSLAEEAARQGAEVIDVAKIPYSRQVAQERINDLMVEHARRGRKVVRLKGGDPFIFGRGFEEIEACTAAGVAVRVVPGVTSMTSAPAAAGISLTHRGLTHDVTLVSGHVPPDSSKSLVDWDAVAQMTGTLVLIMAVRNAGAIAAALIARGRDSATPVSVIENASTPDQRVTPTTLADLGETIARQGLGAPAVIVIGPAAGRRVVPDGEPPANTASSRG